MRSDAGAFSPKWKWRAIAAAAAVVILIAAWHFLPLREWLTALDQRVQQLGFAGALLYVAVLVAGALLFVPGSILGLGAGYLFGLGGGMAVAWVGEIAAAAIGFVIARYFARRTVEKLAASSPTFGAIDEAVGRNGWKVVGLLRLAAIVPFSLSNYLLGLSGVGFGSYIAVTAVGTLPGALFYVYLGAAGKQLSEPDPHSPVHWAVLAVGLVASAATTVILTRIAKRELRRRPHSDQPASRP